jgi:hypothetical protein
VLKMQARVWKSSPCIPANLLSSYPEWEEVKESWITFFWLLLSFLVHT